jgi:hypothetical protein
MGSNQPFILVTKINHDGTNTYLDTFNYNDNINFNKGGYDRNYKTLIHWNHIKSCAIDQLLKYEVKSS